MRKKLSIIIPNYNGEKLLSNCLDSIMPQIVNNMEIVVVDDCSKDNSLEVLSNYPDIQVIKNEENFGFAKSVNQGIRNTDAEFVLLLNNDVEIESDFISEMLNVIEKSCQIFSVSAKMIRYFEKEKLDDTGDFYNILGWTYKRGDGKSVKHYQKRDRIFSTCGGAGVFRKSILDEIGLLDESYFAYLEDIDLSYRARTFGYENWYAPKAICYHIGSATTAEGKRHSSFKVRISARNNIYTIYKNMPLLQVIVNCPFLIVGFLIKGIYFLIKGYGKDFLLGLKEGVVTISSLKKIPFQFRRLKYYLRIEIELIFNLFRQGCSLFFR